MPVTVSCPACSARFTLSDELYQRKVVGNLVTVKCRHCTAEIAVDATEPATMPSHEAPRRALSPPRPKGSSVTKMGLGLPAPPPAKGATGTPLPLNATATPRARPPGPIATSFSQDATATPRGLGAAPKPAAIEPLSIWDTEPTLIFNAPKLPPPRLPPAPHALKQDEPELIEAEEIPASSSDEPTLFALKLEAAPPRLPRGKRAPGDFLVDVAAGAQGVLGAPTIDISSLGSPPPASVESIDIDMEVVEAEEVDFPPANRVRGGTLPLFDMSAVLPAASDAVKLPAGSAAPRAQGSDSPVSVGARAPESKARERKFVVAPQTPAAAPKARRAGAALWLVLLAAAAAIAAVVGLRGRQPAAHATTEPVASAEPATVSVEPPATPAVTEATPEVAAAPVAPDSAAAEAPNTVTPKPSATTKSVASAVAVAAPATPGPSPSPSPSPNAARAVNKPAVAPEATVEKPALPSKPVEVHNAPPPAAEGTEFDRAAARSALASAAAQASACRKDGDPSGTATITITFAPSGRITSANLQGPPFAGTATGGCIASAMRRASVPAFVGEHVTVTKTIVVQ